MKLNGIRDLIPFLSYLDKFNGPYTIERDRDDSVMVCITLVGYRLEVDFFDDHIEYSIFEGSEEVELDQEKLFNMLAKNFE
jgi:hypothetical protein